VTAGVFLVARTHVFFQASPTAATVVVVIGACTALLAALIAIGQDDIKKGLAYSTVSQLGYMFIGVGLGPIGYVAGIFHLLTHGFFKAQLFLSSGSVMHGNDEDQDMKRYGGLARFMPVTAVTMGIAYLAIIGFPPFSGYFSKGQILDAAFHHGGVGYFGWALGVITVAITAFYMSRLYILTFLGKPRWPAGRHPHESPWIMTIPLIALALLAAFGGVLNLTPTGWLAHFLAPVFGGLPPTPTTGPSDLALEAITLALMVVGILAGWFVYGSGKIEWISLRVRFAPAWRLLANKFYVDEIYEFFTVTIGKAVAAFMAVSVEGAIDGAVNGVAEVVAAGANRGRRVQSGLVRSYALGVLLGAVVLIALVVAVWVGGGT
jgi:NADH-quinone oxidoreductase subunit L